jgi:hypothetical protein
MSKWFYDTSTVAATGAARYGSFVGGDFGLLVASFVFIASSQVSW